ncbi:peptidoglycan-binding protein [Nocardiopsis trehalosi]|uniref:peptidoglycan-binding protein n=1 Tax=Nocardiopsis trehalosi TaxID=109329 RepID=UPI000A063111|nr:peptidoglycan-binding protein [Nocardiopsis trehalosi]
MSAPEADARGERAAAAGPPDGPPDAGAPDRPAAGAEPAPGTPATPDAADTPDPDPGSAPDGAAGAAPPGRTRRGRRVALTTAAALLGAACVALGASIGAARGETGDAAATGLPPETAEVVRQTLADTEEIDGELGYGPATAAVSRASGTLTALPGSGDTVARGETLFEVDADPVTLMYGGEPAYREMAPGMSGRDVEQLEDNLDALGYGGFTVDDEYTSGTAAAVAEWQDDRGLAQTGVVGLGSVVFAPGSVRVDAVQAAEGAPAQPGTTVLEYTGTEKVVTSVLDADDRRLAEEGAAVEVVLPDGTAVPGTITEAASVIQPAADGQGQPETTIEVVVELGGDDPEAATADYDLAAVDVAFTAATREDVLTVPIAALLALPEGGFGVQVVDGSAVENVAVDTGMFADGRVEISGGGVDEGTTVGMPQ